MIKYNKELLINAINESSKFNKSQKVLLTLIIEFSENYVINIPLKSIVEMTGFSMNITCKNLNKLEELDFITREKLPNEKVGYIRLNLSNFEPIIDFFAKKQQFISKKLIKKFSHNLTS